MLLIKPCLGEYDAGAHRSRIVGSHISTYMQTLLDEDEEAYKRQFATYRKEGIMPDMLEDMYIKVNFIVYIELSGRLNEFQVYV